MSSPAIPIVYLDGTVEYHQPDNEVIAYDAPDSLPSTADAVDECAICLDSLSSEAALRIKTCQHVFHQSCLMDAIKKKNGTCPICRSPIAESFGSSPSGTMTVSPLSSICPGFSCKTIQLHYTIPSGTQMEFHESPGTRYHGTTRFAYLPDNSEGRALLSRLKYAWMHGFLFTVGTSLSTGTPNSVCWSSVHQKTSLRGGTHGFPDPNYIANCNGSLDALSVPKAADITNEATTDTLSFAAEKRSSSQLVAALEPYTPTTAVCPHTRAPVGQSPSGTMVIEKLNNDQWYSFTYMIPSGIQKQYHPNPGDRYGPDTTRVAFLPVTPQGKSTLQRVKYAWVHGLVFRVGRSLTTGRDNAIVWAGIPHKTSTTAGGPFGFPDEDYMGALNAKLDELGVPSKLP